MAHKKAAGSTRNGRESESKRLGVKKFGGERVIAGVYLYSAAFAQAAEEHLLCEHTLDLSLNQTRHRSGPERLVVTLFREVVPCRWRDLEKDLLLVQLSVEFQDELVHDQQDDVERLCRPGELLRFGRSRFCG